MNVFPQAIATGYIQHGTITGKLKGVMPTQTPTACRMLQASIPLPTCSVYSPFNRCGIPQANSTTSRPRCTSPLASSKVFPCSAVIAMASASVLRSIQSLNANNTRARLIGGVAAHAGKAFAALSTARLTSPADDNTTSRATAPVAGLNTAATRPEADPTKAPSIQLPISDWAKKFSDAFMTTSPRCHRPFSE